MLKMSVYMNDNLLFEQTDADAIVASFFPSPENVLNAVDKQGWYGLVNFCDKTGATLWYKVVPAYSKEFLPT